MAGRIRRFILVLMFVMTISFAPFVSKAENGLDIYNVIQNNGELIVYLNLLDSTISARKNNLSAENFVLSAAGINTAASSVTDIAKQSIRTDYTILCDATMDQFTYNAVNREILSFANSMYNERLRMFYYADGVTYSQKYTASAGDLEQSNSKAQDTKLRIFTNNSSANATPATNVSLHGTLLDIIQDREFRSEAVRHAIIVLTDTDAENVDVNITQLINESHIPIYTIVLGNNAPVLQKYSEASGGTVFRSSTGSGNISSALNNVRTKMKSTVVLTFSPIYDVFAAQNVTCSVTYNDGSKNVSSTNYSMTLSTQNVPTPTPEPTPDFTDTPAPSGTPPITLPPLPTETPYISPTPSATPKLTPEVIYVEVTPVPTDTPVPTFTPPPPTVPPTAAPTKTPIVTATPTEPPAEGGIAAVMDTIHDLLGPDGIWIIGAALLFLFAMIILLIVFIGSHKKKKSKEAGDNSVKAAEDLPTTYEPVAVNGEDGEKTTYKKAGSEGNGIDMLSGNPSESDSEKTTNPFTRKELYTSAQQPSFVGSDAAKDTEGKAEDAPLDDDDNEKTIRIENTIGLKMKLTVDTNGNIQEYPITVRHKIEIGRDANCEVRIRDKGVSRRHTEITYESSGLFVRDLDSSNGTMLNGVKITEKMPLKNHDVLSLGYSTVTVEIFES